MENFKAQVFYVVISKNNQIVWRDIGVSQGAVYGCAYTSKSWADKKAEKLNGYVYKVQGLHLPNYDKSCEADHCEVARATPFCK